MGKNEGDGRRAATHFSHPGDNTDFKLKVYFKCNFDGNLYFVRFCVWVHVIIEVSELGWILQVILRLFDFRFLTKHSLHDKTTKRVSLQCTRGCQDDHGDGR